MAPLRLGIVMMLVVSATAEAHLFKYKELREGCNNTDLKRFWNTTEPIWTHTTAKAPGSDFSCLVDMKINENGSYMIFNRSFYSANTTVKNTLLLKGLVSPGNTFDQPGMLLYHTNGTTYAVENLLYESPDGQCGVFKFSKYPSELRFDLRVKNSSIAKPLDAGCSTFFSETYKYHQRRHHIRSLTVYNLSCQEILQPTKSGC
uniref:Putative lipocalin-3 1 n=1 Tax=Rhipicephalus microplus TaxID=6941 RepID=A0A6M2CXG2_RHIMP